MLSILRAILSIAFCVLCRFQRRLLPSSHECAYMCDGDQNGVLHFIGTLYGTQVCAHTQYCHRLHPCTVCRANPASVLQLSKPDNVSRGPCTHAQYREPCVPGKMMPK